MKRQFQFQHPKRSRLSAIGTLLLALPFTGNVFQPPQAQAQPALIPPAKKNFKPLPPEQKATIAKLLAVSHLEFVCKRPIDLKVEDASLQDVISRIKEILPNPSPTIEVRGASPVRLGFDLKATSVGDVLDHVAALAGCKLFVIESGLLIASPSQLTNQERLSVQQRWGGEWAKSTASGGSGWSIESAASRLFTRTIAEEVTGSDAQPLPAKVVKTTFGNFGPDSQAMLQQMVNWMNHRNRNLHPSVAPMHLEVGSPVAVDTSDSRGVNITFGRGISDANAPALAYAAITIQAGVHP